MDDNVQENNEQASAKEEPLRSSSTAMLPDPSNASQYASYGGSNLAAFIYDIIQQTQIAMENLLPLIDEIEAGSVEIMEEVHRCRESSLERKCKLEEERERFQQAACRVLDMLNSDTSPLTIEAASPREVYSVQNED